MSNRTTPRVPPCPTDRPRRSLLRASLLRAPFAVVLALALALPSAWAATSGNGSVAATVGQLVEVTVTDASIASFSSFTPVPGSDVLKYSTSDHLRFSNAKANVQELLALSASVSFAQASDGSTSTSTVSYQGASVTLTDLVYLAPSSSGNFLPWRLVGSDLTSEGNTGWTNHAGCAAMTYQGSLSVARFTNAGAAGSTLTRYYRVCDSGTELYLSDSKDVSSGDLAYVTTQTAVGASATAANYEVTIDGVPYVFSSAGSASTVTLQQGKHLALGSSSTTQDVYALLRFPDGFPAGTFTATVTGSVSQVVT